MLYAIVALLVIILDQWTKFWVAGHIALGSGSRVLIPGLIDLVNVHNDGAALGFLSGKNAGMFFVILCAVFTIFVIVALATRLVKGPLGRWSLLFIMAGGISNCIDRLLSGYVQDMFMPTFMDKLPIFNVADIFITVFCLLFILYILFGGRSDDDAYEDEDEDEEYDDEDEEYEDEEAVEEEDQPDEEEESEEEEDLPPVRRPSRYDRAARAKERRRSRDEDEDEEAEDEEEEEDRVPARRSKGEGERKRPLSRKERQSELDEKYARYKAERSAREQRWASEQDEPAPVVDPADPFAEWNAAGDKPAAPAEAPAPAPAPEAPVAPVAPAPEKKAPKAAAPEAEESFSLEDILAEFK